MTNIEKKERKYVMTYFLKELNISIWKEYQHLIKS